MPDDFSTAARLPSCRKALRQALSVLGLQGVAVRVAASQDRFLLPAATSTDNEGRYTHMDAILGANGIIGHELSRALDAQGRQVRQVSRNPERVSAADETFTADLLDGPSDGALRAAASREHGDDVPVRVRLSF